MSKFPCLNRRPSGIYAIRLIVPARLRPIIGKREIHISTHLRDREAAKTAAMQILLNWRKKFTQMDLNRLQSGSPMLSNNLISISEAAPAIGLNVQTLLTELYNKKISIHLRISECLGWIVDQNDYIERESDGRLILNSIQELGQKEIRSGFVRPIALLDTLANWKLGRSSDEFQLIIEGGDYFFPINESECLFSVADGYVTCRDVETIRSAQAQTMPLPVQIQYPAAKQEPSEQDAETQDTLTPQLNNKKNKEKTFSWLADSYLKANAHRKDQCQKVRTERNTFIDLMGDMALSKINADVIEKYKVLLEKMPLHRLAQKYKLIGLPPIDRIEFAEKHKLPRYEGSTIRTKLEHLGSILNYGVIKQYLPYNAVQANAGGITHPKTERNSNARDDFTSDELQRIFNNEYANWFRNGHLFADSWLKDGELIANGRKSPTTRDLPYFYWVPLLSLLSGARPNELAQLHLDDIRQTVTGIWYLDFNLNGKKIDLDKKYTNDDENLKPREANLKRLKNPNANRVTPIHSKLIELNFIKYVEALRETGHTRLFEELKRNPNTGRFAKSLGAWFNERYLGEQLGMERDNTKVLYSFRHNFVTELLHQKLPEDVVAQLIGHERGNTEAANRYRKDQSAELLQPIIERLNYPCIQSIAPFDVQLGIKALEIKLAR